MDDVSTKAIFYEHHKLTFIKVNIFDVHAKFVLEWQPLIEANTLT